MRARRRLLAALVTISVILTAAPAAAEPPEPGKVRAAAASTTWITLVTGDRVQVRTEPGKPERVVFMPTRGSGSAGAFTTHAGGHTLVIPTAAMADVAAGRLDRALFDVTTLLAERYDDARSKVLPVIVRYAGSAATARTRAARDKPSGAARTKLLNSIGARGVAIAKASAQAFWKSSTINRKRIEPQVRTILLDRRVKASTDLSVPQIGAPAAWQRGLTGRGVKVAVLDTGIDATHPDLTGKVTASANFSDSTDTLDHVGHGTHVAGTVAGTGAASDGKYRGVAPEATLLNGKVLDDYGFGYDSSIIAGMEWAVGQGAKVVNLSLGGAPTDGTDPLSEALNTVSRQSGTLFVVAAGNCPFPMPGEVSSPASADQALAVANLQRDGITSFESCRGPRKGDFGLKPEIAAPGMGIVAARAAGTEPGAPVGEHYTTLSGTSMATPHVAGTAALLAQAQPDWNGDALKARLISTADQQPDQQAADHGAGRVDADQATDDSVTADAGTLEFGYLRWPNQDQQPITKTLTYRNSGSTPVTLELAVTMEGGDTSPAPKLSASQVVVPAGGQATVDVTADPAAGSTGNHPGRVTATASTGGDPLVTLFGWYLESERYEVTIRGINLDGSAPNSLVLVGRPDDKPMDGLDPEGTRMVGGTATVRVPPGTLDVSTYYFLEATDRAPTTLTQVVAPQVEVNGDTTVTLDARKARPAKLTVAGKDGLTPRYRVMRHLRANAAGEAVSVYDAWITSATFRYFAVPTPSVTLGDLEFRTGGRLEVPPFRARSLGSGGAVVPVSDLDWGPRFTGVRDLVAIDAGTGAPGDLDGVRGKLAIIRHDPFASWPDEVVQAAQEAGAAAVLLFNPDLPGIDDVAAELGGDGLTVPTLRTSRAGANALLELMKARQVTVRITGVASTPVGYDLLAPTRGKVPADPSHIARQDRLARIDESFGAHTAGDRMIEDRTVLTDLEPPFISSPLRVVPLLPGPFTRTSYVSAAPVIRWDQHVLESPGGWYTAPSRSYRAGSRTSIQWFAPVANSGIPDATGGSGVRREGDGSQNWLLACFSALDNGPDHEELFGSSESTLTVKRNGEVIGSIGGSCAFAETPADAADYELTLDARREDDRWKYSTRVRSTWTFRAAGGEAEVMPVILADLGVPSASAVHQVRVGEPARITLGVRHQHGSAGSAFTSATLQISYDGQQWADLPLTATGKNSYQATVTHPVDKAGTSPSLRLEVADENGGRLVQEVTGAYGLIR